MARAGLGFRDANAQDPVAERRVERVRRNAVRQLNAELVVPGGDAGVLRRLGNGELEMHRVAAQAEPQE